MGETTWLAALLLGLAGGGHCAGMCGAVTVAFARAAGKGMGPLRCGVAYHAGRTASYMIAGAIVGALGQSGLALRGSLALQQAAFGLASSALVLTGMYLAGYAPLAQRLESAGAFLWRRIEPWSHALLPASTPRRAFSLGLVWGWLPCGMVYGAALLALSTASASSGAITMAAFALGTMPSLAAIGLLSKSYLHKPVGLAVRRVAAAALIGAGLYGLARLALHASALADWCYLG